MNIPKLIVCLMGPTASGKTDLAIELVQKFPFEIISVDSAMIYREMDIGTAKPGLADLKKAPHHLIDILDPIDSYSAADFCATTLALCEKIVRKGKLPLLVGGTMMYFNALQKGLSTLPSSSAESREYILGEASRFGWTNLYEKLTTIDPVAAKRIHASDTQRIGRALEVYYLTGDTLSNHFAKQKSIVNNQFINISLFPEQRYWLHQRIARRFAQMLDAGFIDEVSTLLDKWQLTIEMPALRCVGYRQAYDFFQGQVDYLTFQEKGIAATRQLAKRQLTWLRHWHTSFRFDPEDNQTPCKLMAKMKEILDNISL